MENEYVLSMEGISKQFPGVRALSNVQLRARKGTVHALMGENGAGKSTLMKCLIGIYAPDSCSITFKGEKLNIIRSLKAQGCVIIYISHKMDEIFKITDEVTVFRDGQYVSTDPTPELSDGKLIEKMVGRTLTDMFHKETTDMGSVLLDVQNLSGKGFRKISFQVKRGEILGLAGLMGAGRTELMEGVFGVTRTQGGSIKINGKEVSIKQPADAIRGGMALLTEDRKLTGLYLNASVRENMFIANINNYLLGPFIHFSRIQKDCEKMPSLMQIIKNLSGGNQQKVLIARWLLTEPDLLILDEPTRGIDVGAKSEIYRLMTEFVRSGKAIIMISSELPEVLGMSD